VSSHVDFGKLLLAMYPGLIYEKSGGRCRPHSAHVRYISIDIVEARAACYDLK